MADITFITANKNYSLWTLPVWLCLKVAGLDFDEVTIPFSDPDARARFDDLSPTGSIPVLKHGDVTIWDSAAICEYIADLFRELVCGQTTGRRAQWRARLLRISPRSAVPIGRLSSSFVWAPSCQQTFGSAPALSMCRQIFRKYLIAARRFGVIAGPTTERTVRFSLVDFLLRTQ